MRPATAGVLVAGLLPLCVGWTGCSSRQPAPEDHPVVAVVEAPSPDAGPPDAAVPDAEPALEVPEGAATVPLGAGRLDAWQTSLSARLSTAGASTWAYAVVLGDRVVRAEVGASVIPGAAPDGAAAAADGRQRPVPAGEITRAFTGLMIAALIQEGHLIWSSPLSQLRPDWPATRGGRPQLAPADEGPTAAGSAKPAPAESAAPVEVGSGPAPGEAGSEPAPAEPAPAEPTPAEPAPNPQPAWVTGGAKAVSDASAEVAGDASAKVAGDASAKVAGDASAKVAGGASAKVVADASAKVAGDASAKAVRDASAKVVGDASAKAVDDASAKAVHDASAKVAGDASAKAAIDASAKAARDASATTASDAPPQPAWVAPAAPAGAGATARTPPTPAVEAKGAGPAPTAWQQQVTRYAAGAEATIADLVCSCFGIVAPPGPVPRRPEALLDRVRERLAAGDPLEAVPTRELAAAGGYLGAQAGPSVAIDPGAAYAQQLDRRVLRPLGLESTAVEAPGAPGRVPIFGPADGLWTTVDDLARVVVAFLAGGLTPTGGRVVESAEIARLIEVFDGQAGPATRGGWRVDTRGAAELRWLGQANAKGLTRVLLAPDAGLGLVIRVEGGHRPPPGPGPVDGPDPSPVWPVEVAVDRAFDDLLGLRYGVPLGLAGR